MCNSTRTPGKIHKLCFRGGGKIAPKNNDLVISIFSDKNHCIFPEWNGCDKNANCVNQATNKQPYTCICRPGYKQVPKNGKWPGHEGTCEDGIYMNYFLLIGMTE